MDKIKAFMDICIICIYDHVKQDKNAIKKPCLCDREYILY